MSAKKATPQKPAAPITSFFAKAPSPSQHAAVGMKGAAMAEGDKATVGVKLNFERPPSNEPSNKDSRSPLRTLDNAAPATEPKSASGANRRVSDGPSEGVAASTRDPAAAPTAEGSPVSASVGDAHFMTPAHALRARDEDATPEDTPATVRRLARSSDAPGATIFKNLNPNPPRGALSSFPRGDRHRPRDPNATLTPRSPVPQALDPRAAPAPRPGADFAEDREEQDRVTSSAAKASSANLKTPGFGQSAVKSSQGGKHGQTPSEMAKMADALEKEAAAEMERLADDAKRAAATADADKDKPTTEPGRLLKRARRARARAEKAAADEELRAKAAAEKEAARAAKEQEKAEREKEKEVARERAAKEKAEKAARIEAEKAAKAEKLARKKAEKEAKLAAEKAEKEAKLAAEKEARAKALEEAKAAKAERDAKLAAEKAQREKEREDAKLAKEAERAKAEADKRAATEAAMAKKNKQKNQFASFFAKAAKKTPEPEAAVVAPPVPAAALDEKRGDELVDAVLTGGNTLGGNNDASSITAFLDDARARWRRGRATRTSGDRWGARRVPKRRRDEGLLGSDRALQDAVDASVIHSVGTHAQPKRRKLISVQCSSHVVVDGACVQEGSYRHAFQLGPDALSPGGTDGTPRESFAKTFPVDGGRPPFWGSGTFPERPGSVSTAVTGRRPFARDPNVEYVTTDGEHFDSGDEWEEVEEGESLSDEDVDEDEGEVVSDEDEDGFVVKDGELSEGEGVKDVEWGDDPMDLADADFSDEDEPTEADPAAPGAPDSSGFRDRTLARLVQWTKQARRRHQPLVIAGFVDQAGVDEPAGAPEVDPQAADDSGSRRDVLRALAPVRFRPGSRAVIRVYDPTVAVNDDAGADAPFSAGKKRPNAEDGGDGGERVRKERSEFPDDLVKPLVEFLLANPKLQSKGAREGFLETSTANGSRPDLTKAAVQRKIADVAEYRLKAPQRWEVKVEVLASVGMTAEEADAIRPKDESEFPDDLVKPLVEFLLLNPKLQSKGAREGFLETSTANGSRPDLTKAAVQRKIADVAEYKGRRWEIKSDALATVGIAPEAAEAMRPPLTPTKAEKAAAERAAKEAARDAIKAENMAKAFAANGGAFFARVTSPKQAAPERPAPPAGPVGDPQSGSGGAGGV